MASNNLEVYFGELPADFYTSDQYKEVASSYNRSDVTPEELEEMGVYTEVHDGKTYHFVNAPMTYNRKEGYVKCRINVMENPVTGEVSTAYLGALTVEKIWDGYQSGSLAIDCLKAAGAGIRIGAAAGAAAGGPAGAVIGGIGGALVGVGAELLKNAVVDFIESYAWDYIHDQLPGYIQVFIDENGKRIMEYHIVEEFVQFLYESEWAPLYEQYKLTEKNYNVGNQILTGWDFTTGGETAMYALRHYDMPVASTFDMDYFTSFVNTNVFQADNVKAIINTCPFVRAGYGEYQGDFSFLIFYFYDVDNNQFTASTPDPETGHQRFDIRYTRYYTMTISNFSGGEPYISEALHEVSSSQSISLYNYWHNWDHTHSLGCIDYIGYNGEYNPVIQTGTLPATGDLAIDYPFWDTTKTPTDNDDPVIPLGDGDTQQQVHDGDVKEPTRPIKNIPIPGIRPQVPTDEEAKKTLPNELPPVSYPVGLAKIYELNSGQVVRLGNALWKEDTIADLKSIWANDPLSAIVSFRQLFVDPANNGTANITLGYVEMDDGQGAITVPVITQRYQTFQCGIEVISRYFNDVRDYQTTISIYLPFIGIKQLDVYEVMGSQLRVVYNVDVITGDCVAILSINRDELNDNKVIAMFEGNVSAAIPLTASDKSQLYRNIASVGTKTIGAIANGVAGNVSGAISSAAGAAEGAINTALSHNISIQSSGSITGNIGAMCFKKPYLIIERPKPYDAQIREKYEGRPANTTTQIKNLSGFCKIKAIHLDNITSATREEINEINRLLLSGIIV